MNKRNVITVLWVIPVLLLFSALSINSISAQDTFSTLSNGAYPPPENMASLAYPPPSVSPAQIMLPPPNSSEAAQKALEYIAKREGIPMEALSIQYDHLTEYPALGRKFQVVTLVDTRPDGLIYKLLVDLGNGKIEENISALLDAEAQAYQSRYGKLQPALYQRLQELGDNDTILVAIWMASQPQKTLADLQEAALAAIAVKYPETQVARERSGKPMDVDDTELARQIETEYFALISDEINARTLPLVTELEYRGFDVTNFAGMPSFTANLPKSVIWELSGRNEVDGIYLVEAEKKLDMNSAALTDLVPTVWGRGYTGSGITIAILDIGNVDPNNTYLNLSATSRPGANGTFDHATETASVAASFHSTNRGIAYSATIVSVGEDGTQTDEITALQWAFNQGAMILNNSGGFEADVNMNWIDRAFDYWTRQRFRMVVKSAGNTGGFLTSPGKAWNILTVGAIEDNNNGNWADDQIYPSSAYINPVSAHNDREKPEIVAIGADVTVLSNNNIVISRWGTSFAAPQVAGLAALLINRNSSLNIWPEALRAIIMSSATHNIEGPSIIVQGQGDLKDGAGAINADFADQIAQLRGTPSGSCSSSCWWGESIDNISFPVYSDITRNFYLNEKSLVRAAIAWWSNADTPANNYSFSRLDTDLDLRIKKPNGQYLSGVYSLSYDNNYEIVEFFAPEPGQYQIVIHKSRADETSNYLGTAVLIIPTPYSIFLPVVMKNP